MTKKVSWRWHSLNKFISLCRQQGHCIKTGGQKQCYVCHLAQVVNIHYLHCAWCAFIFLCAFIFPELKNPHAVFVPSLFSSLSLTKAKTLPTYRCSPSCVSYYYLFDCIAHFLFMDSPHLVIFFLPTVLCPLLSHPYSHLLLIHSKVQWSWLKNKAFWKKRKEKKSKMSACTCTVSFHHLTWLLNPTSPCLPPSFGEHSFPAIGYKTFQHATSYHLVLICCW